MQKSIGVVLAILLSLPGFSQTKSPVQWTFSSKKIDSITFEIHLTAKIEDDWHIYSQSTPAGGPFPTSVSFSKNPVITFAGEPKEIGKLEKRFEELFGVEVKQFSDKVDFVQLVKVRTGIKTAITGEVEFMTCNDQICIPRKKLPFSVTLN